MSSIAGRGLNFHHACSSMVIAELPINLSIITQLIGRLVRTGQKETVKVEILTVERSFDHIRQGYIARKGLNILAGTTEFASEIVDNDNDGASGSVKMKWIVEEILRRELGQASSRVSWVAKSDREGIVQYVKRESDPDAPDVEEEDIAQEQQAKRDTYNATAARWLALSGSMSRVADLYDDDKKKKKSKVSLDSSDKKTTGVESLDGTPYPTPIKEMGKKKKLFRKTPTWVSSSEIESDNDSATAKGKPGSSQKGTVQTPIPKRHIPSWAAVGSGSESDDLPTVEKQLEKNLPVAEEKPGSSQKAIVQPPAPEKHIPSWAAAGSGSESEDNQPETPTPKIQQKQSSQSQKKAAIDLSDIVVGEKSSTAAEEEPGTVADEESEFDSEAELAKIRANHVKRSTKRAAGGGSEVTHKKARTEK